MGDIGNSRTTDSLREEDINLTIQVNDKEKGYRDVYQSVQDLEQTYQSCKGNFPLTRYGDLKAMIKSCVTDAVIEEARRYSSTVSAERPEEEEGSTGGLLGAARQFARYTHNHTSAIEEISKLHKTELFNDIEEKTKRKEKLKRRFLRLYNRLEKLKRDYEESKQHFPPRRYTMMKTMIKILIRDEVLKIDR